MIKRVKGTQDFLDLTLFNFIIEKISHHLALYRFSQIATPIIEHTELFTRSLGTATDVVSKEMFLIEHRGDGQHEDQEIEHICLRPENTAPIVRAFIENGIQTIPWKVFAWGPMFRYERPQKGRYRQFNQISMEIIGAASIAEDAQFIMMLDRFFHETLQMNNYAILLNFLGCPQDRVKFKEKLRAFLDKLGTAVCANCMERKDKNIMRIFDCKISTCQELYQNAPHIADNLCPTCEQEWNAVQLQLQMLSVSYVYKPTLVRGLDYYSKTVFEFASNQLGAQNAFCAGGRYDGLVKELGGAEDQPSLGAAIGIERLMLILENYISRLALPQKQALQVVVPMGTAEQSLALILADVMRASGLCVEVLLEGDSMKSMMRKANKLGAAHCLILGSDELASKTVTVKNMVTGEEKRMPQVEVVGFLSAFAKVT